MRVITGTARGRRLTEPNGMDIRPTTDQVKEALFNIVQFDLEGRRVLDLFAGTGQLGIEALSRGARECVFLDQSKEANELIRKNLAACGLKGQVLRTDSLTYLRSAAPFDLIFIDPPYGKGLEGEAISLISEFDILTKGGIMVIETRKETEVPAVPIGFGTTREYRYGRIKLTVITRGTENL